MGPLSRRNALLLGGFGTAAIAVGGAGLWWTLSSRFSPVPGGDFTEPEQLRGSNGRLQVRLEASPGSVQLGGQQASALAYNGGVPGPTLRVRAGDVLDIELVNSMAVPTNLHVHGLHVSPQGNGDNVFNVVQPGHSFSYEYRLPADHPPGVYWYHPHLHGMVADQIFAGLFGAIIVEDAQPVDVSRERVMVVSDITLDGSGTVTDASPMDRMLGREGEFVLVNGQSNPKLSARPGERERWRIVNTCVSRYLRLRLDGQQMQLLGMDSGRFPTPRNADEVLLAPGNRADVLVTAVEGDATLGAVYYNRGSMAAMMGPAEPAPSDGQGTGDLVLATLSVSGAPAASPPAVPSRPAAADLRTAAVAAHRQVTLAVGGMGMGMMSFTINGRGFNASRTDTTVAAQTVEEWTLINPSPMDHPFHLHVWPMQIVEERGQTPGQPVWRDVVNIPANGQVRVRINFTDFTGRSVYHCHILDHEDQGMMGVIEVR
ncbi:Multicopper oxidase with three cupredoxin domains (includes cell division protein FtsP and spore coat protein CotA) [Arthrobacter sp. ov407]|uniref:multicopper oxidase family protein n=1 Tax=Arthrobacter sp. ov407 TaxID=1761748 RepID=UPI00088B5845|nr:multicopper oxidase family protein [Arthrobacter sp. ov407]SDL44524.1 Multicopper oxidase with three cupredoxin domains (includes cell division protein FtsP and spore coat protein CotA) [Arthrobacter sp. ov407]